MLSNTDDDEILTKILPRRRSTINLATLLRHFLMSFFARWVLLVSIQPILVREPAKQTIHVAAHLSL